MWNSLWLECRQVGFWVSTYLNWILGSKLIRSNNLSRATLWVLETCIIVGLLPFNDHLDHCFVPDDKVWTFEWLKSTLSKSLITLWDCLRLWIVCPVLAWLLWHVFPRRTATIRSHKSSAGSKQRVSPFYRPSIHQISTLEKTKFYQYSILSS